VIELLEWAIVPALMAGVALIPKTKPNDRKTIELIFKNVGYGIRDKSGQLKTPRYKSKKAIYDGVKLIEAKYEGKCKVCKKDVKVKDEVYWNTGVETVTHKKCFDSSQAIKLGTVYKFSILPGLPASNMRMKEKEAKVFTDGLQKPVEIEFKRTLNIKVYDEELPSMFPYADIPKNKRGWLIPIGRAIHGMVWHNLDHVPHMTVAGTTRFGKTVMLRMLMTYLIETHPDDVEFYIIDLKGGLEFGRYESLKQVKKVAADPNETTILLDELEEQYQRDYVYFRKNYFSNIVDTGIKKRRIIIVDEAAQLAPEKWMPEKMKKQLNYCQTQLAKIAYLTGALGYRLIFATQYPTSDTLPRMIKQNADAKVSFRLPSGYASEVAIDDYGAEELPSDIKGRALFKTHELKELQVPFISHEKMWETLEKYTKGESKNEQSNSDSEEKTSSGRDLVKFGNNEVRNTGTTPKKTQSGKGKKRTEIPKRHEGLPTNKDSRGQEHLLPKRKRQGISRKRTGSEMESSNRPPSDEE
jgi:DNA segregation ATPase FtsK/SpoIIIE, S-DNA-T family